MDPYSIIGVSMGTNDDMIRKAYRQRLLEFKEDRRQLLHNRRKNSSDYQLLCRAFETLVNPNKKKIYDETLRWTSFIPIEKYTIQQLAADPYLPDEFEKRLKQATFSEINAQDPETGHTPLYAAARVCNADAIFFLIEHDADPDVKQKYGGSTALHVAAFYGHIQVVTCLLQIGADYTIKNDHGNTAEDETDSEGRKEFQKMMKDPYVQAAANQLEWFRRTSNDFSEQINQQYHSLRQTLLHCASKKGHYHLVRWLVEECKANLDILDINMRSALHLATHKGHDLIVEYLLEAGANPQLINKWGMTAEQEGLSYGNRMTRIFDGIRKRDMHTMAFEGKEWWFHFHFDIKKIDEFSASGNTVLYLACRQGHLSLVEWLLDQGASVNKRQKDTKSTPLHGAAYYDHSDVVEMLIAYGADMNIRNSINETALDNARTDKMRRLFQKYRDDLREQKVIAVHLYGDGKSSGNNPLAKLFISWDATLDDLRQATRNVLGDDYDGFTIARRPLHTEGDRLKVVSALYRARHADTKFIDLPICLTVHERQRYMNSGHVMRPEPVRVTHRDFDARLRNESQDGKIRVYGDTNDREIFSVGDLKLIFEPHSTNKKVSITIHYVGSVDPNKYFLPGGVCLFQLNSGNRSEQFVNMPTIIYDKDPSARLYSWIPSTAFWFGSTTTRLPMIDGIHAFVQHIKIFPPHLILPSDILMEKTLDKPLRRSNHPVSCLRLQIREHDVKNFPHTAYHGTKIGVIRSILMDGFVMPSTVVSTGFRVCPPDGHIARGVSHNHIKDFANGIFVSPSVHYCSDQVYAQRFQVNDKVLIPVIECAVKEKRFRAFASTVPGYKAHPSDDLQKIEWRLDNPGDIQITAVLFIEKLESTSREARKRADHIGIDAGMLARSYRKFI